MTSRRKKLKRKVPSIVVHNGSSTLGSPAMDAAGLRGTGLEKQAEGDEPPAADDLNHKCNAEAEEKPPPTKLRSQSKVKLLVRSHAVREEASPPPDPGPLDTPQSLPQLLQPAQQAQPTQIQQQGSSASNDTLRLTTGNRPQKFRHQGSSQGSGDSSCPSPGACLSRDSSTEQAPYTDSSGVDLQAFLAETLSRSPKDRQQLLRVENELLNLARDTKRTHFKFPPMSSYQRMLVHRAAAYYGMEHNVDPTGSAVIVNRSRATRLPDMRFRDLMGPSAASSGSQGTSTSLNTPGGCGSGSRCCPQPEVESRVPASSVITSVNSGNNFGPEEPRRSILKRDSASFEENFKSPERQLGCDPPRRSKSFEEREEEYERARQRIFHHHHHHNPPTNHHRPSSGGATSSPPTSANLGSGTAATTVCHDGVVSEDCNDTCPVDPVSDSVIGEDEGGGGGEKDDEEEDIDNSDWPQRGAPWESPSESSNSAATDHLLRPSAALRGGSQQQQRLLKVESFEGRDTLKANSLRPQVSKSYSFGGYPGAGTQAAASDAGMGAGPRMLLTKQDSGSSSVSSRLSPSTSSGYKSQSQRSDATLSATPSPTATPTGIPGTVLDCQAQQPMNQTQQSPSVMWVVTSMSAVPPGSVLINPQTGRPVVNDDGTVYRWDPSNPPLSLDLCEVSESKPAASADWCNIEVASSTSPCSQPVQLPPQEQPMLPEKSLHEPQQSSLQPSTHARCLTVHSNSTTNQQQQQQTYQELAHHRSTELSLQSPQESIHQSSHQNSQQTPQPTSLSPIQQSVQQPTLQSAQMITESSHCQSQQAQLAQPLPQSPSLSPSHPPSQTTPQLLSQQSMNQVPQHSTHKPQQLSPQSVQNFQQPSQQVSQVPSQSSPQLSQQQFPKQSQQTVQQHSQSSHNLQQSPQQSQPPSCNPLAMSSPVPQQFPVPSQGSVVNSSPRVTTTATSPAPPPTTPPSSLPSQQNSQPSQPAAATSVTCIPVTDPQSALVQGTQVQGPTVHQYQGQPLVSTQHGSGAELVFTPQPLVYLPDPRTATQPPPPAPEPTAATLHDLSGYFMGMSLSGQEPPPPPQPQQPPPPPPPPPPPTQPQARTNASAGAGGGDTNASSYGVPYWAQQQQQQQSRQPPAALYYVPATPVQVAAASPPSAAAAAAVAAAAAAAVASHHHHHHPHPHHRYLTAGYPQPAYAPQSTSGAPQADNRQAGPAPPPPAAVSAAHGLVAHAGGYVTTGYHPVAATSAYSPATNGGNADCGVPTAVYPATQLQPLFYPHPATAAPAPAPAPTPPHTPTQTQALCHPAAGYVYLNGGYAGPQPPAQPPPPSLFNGAAASHMAQGTPGAPQPPHPHPLLPSLHVFPRPSVQMLSGVRSSPPPRPRGPPNTGMDQSLSTQSHKSHGSVYHHRPGIGKDSRMSEDKAAQHQQQPPSQQQAQQQQQQPSQQQQPQQQPPPPQPQQQQQQLGYPTTLPLLGLRLVPTSDMRLVGAPLSAGPGAHTGLRVPFSPVCPPGGLRMPSTANINDPSGGNGRPPRARKPRCKMPMNSVSGPARNPAEERSTSGHKTGAAPAPCC